MVGVPAENRYRLPMVFGRHPHDMKPSRRDSQLDQLMKANGLVR